MLRLAILSARGRLGTFTGALVALTAAAVLAMAWGMQLEAVLRAHPPVERYAGAAAVISGQQNVGTDNDVFFTGRHRARPRRLPQRARPCELGAHHPAGVAPGRAGSDRRPVGAGQARGPGHRSPWVGPRGNDGPRGERRRPAHPPRTRD